MVETPQRQALQHRLQPDQYRSHDSAPPLLSRPVASTSAPQVLALATLISFVLLILVERQPALRAIFPDGDLYFSQYDGNYAVPLRIFVLSFYLAFATTIQAPGWARLLFGLELVLPFALFCATLDLCNGVLLALTGVSLPLQAISIITGLAGFYIFSLTMLSCADMPERDDARLNLRFKLGSLLTLASTIVISAAVSVWVMRLDLPIVYRLREMSLLGGVAVGLFMFVPLIFFLLNILAAFQNLFRGRKNFAPDITLLIPAHNESHNIAAAIAAADIAAGNYAGAVTLIVVDNNSSDDTPAAAEAAFARCEHVTGQLLREPTPGKSRALNRGLAAVQTEFFARLDADTLLHPQLLADCLAHFAHPYVGCVGGMPMPPGGGAFDGPRQIEVLLKSGYDQVAFGAADVIIGIPGMFACYRTAVVREVGGFANGLNGEDTDAALRIGEAGYRLIVDPQLRFISEVPRSFAHLREQRQRWYRSLYHVAARNRQLLAGFTPSVRGKIVLPFMLMNTGRRAMGWPLLFFAINFLLLHADPRSTASATSLLAILMGAPLLNAVIAILVNLRPGDLLQLPAYIAFRMLRYYFTLEAVLSMTFERYTARAGVLSPARERARLANERRIGTAPAMAHRTIGATS
ncbi:glycosyltransferase family 2 protein [Devosia sp. 1566]|uniref:glycosyltransferase n=1 Tax=Devosia sp. 1566 TaxID=2499144 RepID=UPI000FD951F5|nr:glycosyltransferase family 2 protein [Devosia sp. 1566]